MAPGTIRDHVILEFRLGSVCLVARTKDVIGVDPDARPAEVLFEVVSGAVVFVVVAADIEEKTVSLVVEKVADDQFLVVLRIELLPCREQVLLELVGRFLAASHQHRDPERPEEQVLDATTLPGVCP